MSRILMTSLAVKGHINPMLALGEALVALGHTVAWLPRRIADFEPPRPSVPGIEVLTMEWRWMPPDAPPLNFGEAARELGKFIALNREWRVQSIEPLIPRVREVIRAFEPDVMVIDGQVYPGVIAAHLEGLPFAGVITSPALLMPKTFDCEFLRVLGALEGLRAEIFCKYGVPPRFGCWDYLSPWLNVVFALPALVGAGATLPPDTVLVGPSIYQRREDEKTDFPWSRLAGDRPIVYASFGTVWYCQPDLFRMIAEAAASLGVQLVLTLGDLVDTDFPARLPGAPIAVRYTPQLRILERAAVCVSHGGANTVMESLYYGVPLLVVPLCTDQPVNGYFVEQAGAGVSIPPATMTSGVCRDVLSRLLAPGNPYRATARRLQAAYRGQDGAREAADRITRVLARSRARATA